METTIVVRDYWAKKEVKVPVSKFRSDSEGRLWATTTASGWAKVERLNVRPISFVLSDGMVEFEI